MAKAIEEVLIMLKRIEGDVQTIKRGMYGDEQNNVKGLIALDDEKHRRIKKLEESKKKLLWFIGGALTIVELLVQTYKYFINV